MNLEIQSEDTKEHMLNYNLSILRMVKNICVT